MAAGDPPESTEALVDELIPLLMAAQEPPAVALTWLLDHLGRDPDLAERFSAVAGEEAYRDAVIRETLRLHPPAAAALRRLTGQREVAGHRLPAGATVMVPIPLVQRDPRAFPEDAAFRPERWTSGASPDGAFLPFGGGARRCLGEHLALACLGALAPALVRGARLRPAGRGPERMVLRGTTLVTHRSAPMRRA
jgi:cytochrome P450